MSAKVRENPRRENSRAFSMSGKRRSQLAIDVPPGMLVALRAKAKRDRVSMRAVALRLLDGWLRETPAVVVPSSSSSPAQEEK
jgi:hypothetical protein